MRPSARQALLVLAFAAFLPPACSDGRGACPADATGGAGGSGGGDIGPSFLPWPTPDPVIAVDDAAEFTGNLSGLSYQPGSDGAADVMWGVRNAPSLLYRLAWNGSVWTSADDPSWSGGRPLRFPDGKGEPDAEGVTRAEGDSPAIYVSVERDDIVTIRRFSVLRFDVSSAGTTLSATREWNLTADLPAVDSNLGLEGIAWLPDAFLVDHAFFDQSTNAPYDPARYGDHAGGLFLVGLEANGIIYAYALDHAAGGFTRVATIDGGQTSVVELAFDRDTGALWSYCDITCHNKAVVLAIDSTGAFTARRFFAAPVDLPDSNNEGFTLAPASTCRDGVKPVWWSDDSDTAGHSIRQGTVPCALF